MKKMRNGLPDIGMGLRKYLLGTLLPAAALVGIVVCAVMPFSCRTSIEGIEFLSGDFSIPQITGIVVPDSNTVSIGFSKNVKVEDAVIVDGEGKIMDGVAPEVDDVNAKIDFRMKDRMVIGKRYVLDAVLEDSNGNSVTVSVNFLGYNDRIPALALSEIRIKNKSGSDKTEFVELYALSSGNLSGLELVSAADGENKKFVFPPAEVAAGEYIVVHMRNGTEGCINEVEKNTSLARTSDSSRARDFFAENENDGRFGTSADIIVLRNGATGKVLDAFAYGDPAKPGAWGESFKTLAVSVEESGAWVDSNGEPRCALDTAFPTATLNRDSHTACRRDVEKMKPGATFGKSSQWYEVTSTKAQTPGTRN